MLCCAVGNRILQEATYPELVSKRSAPNPDPSIKKPHIKKNLECNCFGLLQDLLPLKAAINTGKQKTLGKKLFFYGILIATYKGMIRIRIQIRIRNPVYGSKDPDPYQNVTDPDHCYLVLLVE
jgi:hypothetical protein